ncbi:hypothetical protein GCM10010343_34750 [Streptomyces avidinii]|uniref:TetR family transcriptional regulator n=1 Tax=Streptomyces avidinii TaxID=1895 RepID=A0ABS4LFN8_STRAV|nr:hypothetical protein [Streptomyces avidinii]GGZ05971.1 hypothetical protein GCM10010343_34750 [Streptomyces avidinii]
MLDACAAAQELRPGVAAYTLLRAIGNLCITGPGYGQADAKGMVALLLAGCRSKV